MAGTHLTPEQKIQIRNDYNDLLMSKRDITRKWKISKHKLNAVLEEKDDVTPVRVKTLFERFNELPKLKMED